MELYNIGWLISLIASIIGGLKIATHGERLNGIAFASLAISIGCIAQYLHNI